LFRDIGAIYRRRVFKALTCNPSRRKIMNKKEAYQEKFDAQLREWSAKIDELKAKADQAKAEAKIEYYEQIEALRTKQAAAQTKLQELSTSGEQAWEELKPGLEHAWDDLKTSVENAMSKFK